MSTPSVYIKAIRDLSSQEHLDRVAAVKALLQAGIYEMPEALAAYFKTTCMEDVDFDAPGTLVDFRFDDYDRCKSGVSYGQKVMPACIEWAEDEEMATGIRIDLEKMPEGVRFIDVKLAY